MDYDCDSLIKLHYCAEFVNSLRFSTECEQSISNICGISNIAAKDLERIGVHKQDQQFDTIFRDIGAYFNF